MSGRVLLAVAGVTVALLAGAPAANAAQLFAVPTGGSTVGNCTNIGMNPPCTLTYAVETVAVDTDEVIVNPGTYNEPAELQVDRNILIHGVAGQPRPEIVSPSGSGLRLITGAAGTSVSYLGLTGQLGIRIEVDATIDQVIARGTGFPGCFVVPDASAGVTIQNSVCRGAAGSRGVDYESIGAIVDTLTLRNVTAFAPDTGSGGNGILVLADAGSNLTVDAVNVIADGATDVNTIGGGGAGSADLSFSNYVDTAGTVTDPTTMNNQMTPPVFADADLHQAASSPTINAGSGAGTIGLFDVDGYMRTVDATPDIGADEFVPPRYASPTGSASGQCTSPDPMHPTDPPCNLQRAVEDIAVAGNEVIVNPGVYNETNEVTVDDFGLNVHGVAGQPRPQIINTGAGYGVRVSGAGSSVRYLRMGGDAGGIGFSAAGSADQIIAQPNNPLFRPACEVLNVAGDVTVSNSVCLGDAEVPSLSFTTSVNVGSRTLTLRNVTALAPPGTTGVGIVVEAGGGSTLTLDAKNVIADGDVTDVLANEFGGGNATATLAFSNYVTRLETSGATVTDPATASNQMTLPVFADADLHQASSSPTINAGTSVGLVGAVDLDGDARTLGAAPDIGADEFVPVAVVNAPSNAFTIGTLRGKKLTLNVESAGSVAVAATKLLKPSTARGGPGAITVTLKLTKLAKQKLREKGKVKVKAQITFTPDGGTASSQTAKLKIKSK